MSKPTITEFLEARIAEDEALACEALVGMHGEHEDAWDWGGYVLGADRDSTPKQDEFIIEWWPARVLAECAAKRAIIGWWTNGVIGYVEVDGELTNPLLPLATVYASHPDYDPEWAPSA